MSFIWSRLFSPLSIFDVFLMSPLWFLLLSVRYSFYLFIVPVFIFYLRCDIYLSLICFYSFLHVMTQRTRIWTTQKRKYILKCFWMKLCCVGTIFRRNKQFFNLNKWINKNETFSDLSLWAERWIWRWPLRSRRLPPCPCERCRGSACVWFLPP